MSESRGSRATSVPILVFLGLSVLELGPMYATGRRQTKASLNASALWGWRHNNLLIITRMALGGTHISAKAQQSLLNGRWENMRVAALV